MATAAATKPSNAVFPSHKPTILTPSSHKPLSTSLTQNQALEAAKDIVFGSTAGVLGKFVEYPFDTIKVRLQSRPTYPLSSGRLDGPLDAFAAAWRSSEGPLRSLYRGISAPLFGAAVETSSLFFSYRIAQDLLVSNIPSFRALQSKDGQFKTNLPFSALLFAGAASGAFTSLLLTPIELIKCKMQVPVTSSHFESGFNHISRKPPGPYQLIKLVFKSQGLLGFWHGQLGTLIRETGGSAAWFGSYEGVKILFEHRNNVITHSTKEHGASSTTLSQQLLAGATAGISYNFFFYPADTIKSRMQTEGGTAAGSRQMNFMSTGRELWNQQGLRGFYRGCGITVFRAAPSSAIIFSIYEALKRGFA